MIRYDNLTPAVIRVALGRDRLENGWFIALRSLYGFDSFVCIPGIDDVHEMGGVEGEVGWFRRRWLTAVPEFDALANLNVCMAQCDAKDQKWVISAHPITVGAAATAETPLLLALPCDVLGAGPIAAAGQ